MTLAGHSDAGPLRRSRSQAAVHEEARQRELFAALPNAVLVTTPAGVITQANPAARSLFGLKHTLTGLKVRDLLPLVDATPDTRAGGFAWHGAITRADAPPVDVEVVRTRLEVSNLPESLLYVVHDVSKLTELSRMREQLLYDVAHELRGPLGVLENALEILASEYSELTVAEFTRLLASGRRTASRLHSLMEDLLSAGSIQSGRFAVQLRSTLVRTILDEAGEAVEALLSERGQRLEIELANPNLRVIADQRHASRLVSNLLTNAAKYGPENAPIVVRVSSPGNSAGEPRFIRFDIEDRGPGISAEQQSGLFERFYRVRSPSEAPGIGLGLAIAQGIVDAHGGEIGVESAPGSGTRVWFTLPAVSSQ